MVGIPETEAGDWGGDWLMSMPTLTPTQKKEILRWFAEQNAGGEGLDKGFLETCSDETLRRTAELAGFRYPTFPIRRERGV